LACTDWLALAWAAMHPPPALDRKGVGRVDETRQAAKNPRGRLPADADISEAMVTRFGQG